MQLLLNLSSAPHCMAQNRNLNSLPLYKYDKRKCIIADGKCFEFMRSIKKT